MGRRSAVHALAILVAVLAAAAPAGAVTPDDSRIVGGEPASRDYPHQVYINANGFACGGTLVTPTKVLTAAHCVFDDQNQLYPPDSYTLRIGTHDISGDEGSEPVVASVAAHPLYDPVTVEYDAAVLTLDEAVTEAPLSLISSADVTIDEPETIATVIGWGRTSDGGETSDQLLEVEVPIRTDAECAEGVSGYDATLMLCAGVPEGGKDSCQGDSGGPLLLPADAADPNAFTLGGIVSFGDGCAVAGKYGAYVRLRNGKATRWIRDRLGFPHASAVATNTAPRAGNLVTFTATASNPSASALTYSWDFNGDNVEDASGKTVTTSFPTTGRKDVTVTVEDAQGDFDVAAAPVTVAPAGARSDFNGDGVSDLAIGAPGEDTGGPLDGGAINVQYGNATSGLVATGAQHLTMTSPGVAGTMEGGERFGAALAAGDLNGDGYDDLAVGAPGDKVGTAANAGSVVVLYGSRTGLTATNSRLVTQGATYGDTGEAGDAFGSALASASLGKSIHEDLAIGAPGENAGAGVVHVLYGATTGLSTGRQVWNQTAFGSAASEAGDGFGASLAAANFGKTAQDDLAIGLPKEDNGAVEDGGAVLVAYGTAAGGLTAADDIVFTQSSASVPGTDAIQDAFGSALAAADMASGTQADLAVGVPGKTVTGQDFAGSVVVLPGSAGGLTGTGSHERNQDTSGVLDAAEPGDAFGSTLAAADLGGGTKADLAIGAPGETVGTIAGAGQVAVLYGSTATLQTTGNQVFNQDTTGVADLAETGDEYGRALTAGNYGKTAKGDLVVGVPSEDIGTPLTDAGAIGLMYGGTTGALSATGNVLLHQNSTGVLDASEVGDAFGGGL